MNTHLKKSDIDELVGTSKTHFLNDNARRNNKSLGDLVGIQDFGFHLVEIQPGRESTELHCHYFEDECVYVLQGIGKAVVGEESFTICEGDFIGYPAGGAAHTIINQSDQVLRYLVVGARKDHDVADYPNKNKRIYRNKGIDWELVDLGSIERPGLSNPNLGKK